MFLSASLTAQADEGDWYVTQLAAYTDDDGDRRLDDSVGGGEVRVGWRWTDVFALEGLVGYHRINGWPVVQEQRQYQEFLDLGLNVVSSLNPNGNFSPYLIFGAGYLGTKTELGAKDNRPSGTAGLGLKVRFGDSPWSLRAEWRLRHAFDSDNPLTDQIGSLGIRYSFGGGSDHTVMTAVSEPEPVVEPDTDGDGVKADVNGSENIELKPVYFETESAVLFEPARRDGSSTFDQPGKPTRGMTRDSVEANFGSPQSTTAAIGDPPISRWDYADFVVFFENERVIHAVTKR